VIIGCDIINKSILSPDALPRGILKFCLLKLLSEKSMYGVEITAEIEKRTKGLWKPSPGSLYPALNQLSEMGCVSAKATDGKKEYKITAKGREMLFRHFDTKKMQEHTQLMGTFLEGFVDKGEIISHLANKSIILLDNVERNIANLNRKEKAMLKASLRKIKEKITAIEAKLG